jgi:deazaflavin-dependent oxidoreductase (nitroreductase family)
MQPTVAILGAGLGACSPPGAHHYRAMETSPSWASESFCYVTTVGRVTGRLHTVEMWFGTSDGVLYALSGGGEGSDWVRNLMAEPNVTVRVGDQTFPAVARVVEPGAEEDARARRLLASKYQGWEEGAPMSVWARTALPITFTPA